MGDKLAFMKPIRLEIQLIIQGTLEKTISEKTSRRVEDLIKTEIFLKINNKIGHLYSIFTGL